MQVDKVYVNTYKFDFRLARICIASIRYWYPAIPIFLIKDLTAGAFSTRNLEEKWNVGLFPSDRKRFGWGFGKLEPLFVGSGESFLVVDADTVLTGPILDTVAGVNADFIVDKEVQPFARVNEIYYSLDNLTLIDPDFVYPGYTFNTGQWYGTSGQIRREDFEEVIEWTEPPSSKFAGWIFNGDQGHQNFIFHSLERQNRIKIERRPVMIWPDGANADFINLDSISAKQGDYPYILHWAGMSRIRMKHLPRADILRFYRNYYYSIAGPRQQVLDGISDQYQQGQRRITQLQNKLANGVAK